MVRKFLVLLISLTTLFPAWGATFQAQLKGTTLDGGLLLSSGPSDGPGRIQVSLAGVTVPPSAREQYTSYCRKVLADRPLLVKVMEVKEETPVVRSYVGVVTVVLPKGKKLNLNKQLLVDGYAMADKSPMGQDFARYQEAGKKRAKGLWSKDRSQWVVPKIARQEEKDNFNPQMTDRDRTIAKYGLPDFTRKERPKMTHSISSTPFVIKDFYVRIGMVFIYIDGRLLNKQPYTQQG